MTFRTGRTLAGFSRPLHWIRSPGGRPLSAGTVQQPSHHPYPVLFLTATTTTTTPFSVFLEIHVVDDYTRVSEALGSWQSCPPESIIKQRRRQPLLFQEVRRESQTRQDPVWGRRCPAPAPTQRRTEAQLLALGILWRSARLTKAQFFPRLPLTLISLSGRPPNQPKRSTSSEGSNGSSIISTEHSASETCHYTRRLTWGVFLVL